MNKNLIVAPIVVGLATPSLVIFYLQLVVGNYTVAALLTDILSRQFAPGHNLFLLVLIGLIPFLLLSVILFFYAKRHTRSELVALLLAGLAGILLLMVPAHYSVWYPLYGPGRISSTAVIAFLVIPVYCIASMLIGLVAGWGFVKIKKLLKHMRSKV